MFADELEQYGQQLAFVTEQGESVSYLDLAHQVDAVYAEPEAPKRKHIPIAIECDNALPTVRAYLGALRHRIPALLIDAQLPEDLRSKLYQRFDIATVFTSQGLWQETGFGKNQQPAHQDLALLLSTSGSTGEPKLVKLTLSNLQANATSIGQYLHLSDQERPITTLPLHYSYGLSVLNSHLAVGATILLTNHSVASAPFWNFFKTHQATSFSGVPAIYAILRKMRFERMALPSLRTMTQAGGAMPVDDTRWLAELAASKDQTLYVMYGQTEATARMAFIPPDRLLDKLGSIGTAIPNGQLKLIDERGQVITEARKQGELLYVGPNVMMGYATQAADLAAPDELGQTLRTGDLGWQDEDGFFYVTGRLKRFIKVFGNRIGLDEVENDLKLSGWDVAVTGRDDLLMIACRDGQADLATLAQQVSHRYRLHPSAIKVAALEAFPTSSAGKLQYQTLLQMIESSMARS